MALYREGKAAMAADGTVTGTGTKWQSSLSLIRPGATIMFLSSPIQMAVVNKVVSDTEIKAITTNGAVVTSTDYAILLSDSLTVDGLAQDVAETLRYYQSQETEIADAVDFFKNFDFEALQSIADQVRVDSEAADASASAAAASEVVAKTSETNSKASELAAEAARDQVQQIINDAGDASTLVVLAQPTGGRKSGLEQGGTVQDALYKKVTVEAFANLRTDPDDWSIAFAAACATAETIGASAVYCAAGNYKFKPTRGYDFVLPFDDGTYDSRRVGETTLPAEAQHRMSVGLNWPSNISLIGDGISTTTFEFLWDNTTVDLNQTIGMCLRVRNWDGTYTAAVGAKNRMTSDIANIRLDGFTIKNAALGIVADGTVGSCSWGELQFTNCGHSMAWMGGDRCTIKKLRFNNCAAGFTIGGWWLTRNDISGSNTGFGVPPYVAGTDVFCAGWSDFVIVESTEYTNSREWESTELFNKVDTFFDTYFYKTANSKRTADGGRCTNTGPNLTSTSTLAADRKFKGISKRAWSQIARYHRNHILNEARNVKTWGCNRKPILTSDNDNTELSVPGCIIGTAYIEHTGKRVIANGDYTVGGSNDFVTSGIDPWQDGESYNKYWCAEGNAVVMNGWPVNTLGLFASARTIARNDNGYENRMRRTIIDDGAGRPKIIEQLSPDVYILPPQKFIPNAVGAVDDKYYWKQFEKDVSSLMTLYAGVPTTGTQNIITTSSKRVFMERLGNRVKLKVVFDASNYASGGDSPVVIGFKGIYTPVNSLNQAFALNTYGPVRTVVISSKTFTINDTGGVARTFRLEPVAHESGGFVDDEGKQHYYFALQKQRSTDVAHRFLWSDMAGARFQIEIEYDTADSITSSSVFPG